MLTPARVLTPAFLAHLSGGASFDPALPDAAGVCFHSGRVRPGDAFFALPGSGAHGIHYADEALAKGAAFVVSDRPHPKGIQLEDPAHTLLELGRHARAQLRGPVVGITGSAGKTSTKAFAAAALDAAATPGNFNTPYALSQVLVDAWLRGRTGPADRLVLELGIDHIGEMDVLVSLARPTHGVLTLVAPGHLAGLKDVETVAREKSKLLSASATRLVGNEAAPLVSERLPEGQELHVYGLDGDACATHRGRVLDSAPYYQVLEFEGVRVRLPYPGEAMARNAVAALALAQLMKVDITAAAGRLESARLEPSRLQVIRLGALTVIDDSYNSNPASAALALQVLRQHPGPHTAILGDMLELGVRSDELHRTLGRQTLGLDSVIATGPEARVIIEENPEARHFAEVEELVARLETLPLEGTILVKASRGMRLERVVEALKQRMGVA